MTLVADLYGSDVEFHGRVAGLGAGTGSAFSLLPAQNATGNWIKVVQRVPVRVELDPKELAAHPLRIGLSMVATVDVREQGGKALADAPRTDGARHTSAFENMDAAVRRIVAAQLGGPAASAGRTKAGRAAPAPSEEAVAAASAVAPSGTPSH